MLLYGRVSESLMHLNKYQLYYRTISVKKCVVILIQATFIVAMKKKHGNNDSASNSNLTNFLLKFLHSFLRNNSFCMV